MAWVRDYFNGCDSLDLIGRYGNASRIGTAFDADAANSQLKLPRAQQNSVIVTEGGRTFLRVHQRQAVSDWQQPRGDAPNRVIPAGTWCSGGVHFLERNANGALVDVTRTRGRWKFDFRFSGLGTSRYVKTANMLWPTTAAAPPELDMVETFGGPDYWDKNRIKSVFHRGAAYPSTQDGHEVTGFDFTQWHTGEFIWYSDRMELWIDGARQYMCTHTAFIPDEPMRWDIGSALTERRVLLSGTRTAGYLDLDNLEHYYDDAGGGTTPRPPSVPANHALQVVSPTELLASYSRASDPDGDLAGYELRYGTSQSGPWTVVQIPNKETLSRSLTGLAASTPYYSQVRSYDRTSTGTLYSEWSVVASATTPAAGGGTAPTASVSVTPSSGEPALPVTVSTAGTVGDVWKWTISYGDGTSQTLGANTATVAVPATFAKTYTQAGDYTITWTVENGNGTTSATAQVSVTVPRPDETAFLNLPLPVVGETDVRDLGGYIIDSAQKVDDFAASATVRSGVYLNAEDVVWETRLPEDEFPRRVMTADGRFWPSAELPPGNGLTPVITGTATAAATVRLASGSNSADTSVTATTLSLPEMAANTTATWVVGVRIGSDVAHTAPAGWTVTRYQHSNGNTSIFLLRRHFGVVTAAGDHTLSWATGGNYASAWMTHSNATGFVTPAVDTRGGATTADTVHPMPSVTTTQTNQVIVGFVAGKTSTASTRTFSEDDPEMDIVVQRSSASTSVNNMAVGLVQFTQPGAEATPIKSLTSNGGMFTVGGQLPITHA